MKNRPTLDDLQKERADFIGPHEPPRGPKMQREITEQELDEEGRYWEEKAAEISRDFRSRGSR